MRSIRLPTILTLLTIPTLVFGQSAGAGQSGRRPLLPRDREISLARSAAPAGVSDSATIYLLTDRGYEVALRGSNGVSCIVSRSWAASVEPVCYDQEAAETIMRMELRRVELLHQGVSKDSVERDIALGLTAGRFRLPRRPAMSYMMSSAQQLISDDGRPVGRWQPHLMIYYPFLTGRDIGAASPDPTAVMVVDEGQPSSQMMIVVRAFVDPR
jgi:hypothetical protein